MVKKLNILIGLKMTCLGILDRGDREKDNETGLKEGGVIEMSNYSAFHIRDARSLSLFVFYLPVLLFRMAVLHLDMVNNGISKMLESSRRRTLLDVVSNGVKIKRYIVIRKCP